MRDIVTEPTQEFRNNIRPTTACPPAGTTGTGQVHRTVRTHMCGDSGAGAETCAPARDDADALENATTFSEERMEEITSLLAYAELPALLMDLDRCDEELGAAL